MKVELKIKKEFDIKILSVKTKVRYWEDAYINGERDETGHLIPCKKNDYWCPEIEIETGKIINWEHGKEADIHFKVCDCCGYSLKDESGNIVFEDEGYVPSTLSPKEEGYGDYIIMDINKDGFIMDWEFDITDFINED